jgi:hypothetical protein
MDKLNCRLPKYTSQTVCQFDTENQQTAPLVRGVLNCKRLRRPHSELAEQMNAGGGDQHHTIGQMAYEHLGYLGLSICCKARQDQFFNPILDEERPNSRFGARLKLHLTTPSLWLRF